MSDPQGERERPRDNASLRGLRRLAYHELGLAIDQADGELPADWLVSGDQDLRALRALNEPEWRVLQRRSSGKKAEGDLSLPEPAWGDPHRRRFEWAAVGGGALALAAAVVLLFAPILALVIVAIVLLVVSIVVVSLFAPRKTRKVFMTGLLIAVAVAVVVTAIVSFLPTWTLVAAASAVVGAIASLLSIQSDREARDDDERVAGKHQE